MLLGIKILKLGLKVDYWCNKNIKLFADEYNFYLEQLNDIYSRYCNKDDNEQYVKLNDNGVIVFNFKPNTVVKDFEKEMNELMYMPSDEFEPYVMGEEVFNNLPNVESSKFNIDLLAFLLPE
jgi:hypothetical protein